jgi:hypothetical protein
MPKKEETATCDEGDWTRVPSHDRRKKEETAAYNGDSDRLLVSLQGIEKRRETMTGGESERRVERVQPRRTLPKKRRKRQRATGTECSTLSFPRAAEKKEETAVREEQDGQIEGRTRAHHRKKGENGVEQRCRPELKSQDYGSGRMHAARAKLHWTRALSIGRLIAVASALKYRCSRP